MTRLRGFRRPPLPLVLAGALGVGAALLVACGASSTALIPAGNAGQLKSDFGAVAGASCGQALTDAVAQTRSDLAALPATLDARLRQSLENGVRTLTTRAPAQCTQSTPTNTTTTNTNTNTTTTSSTPTNTTTTSSTPTNTNTGTTTTSSTPTNTTTTSSTPTDTTGGTQGTPTVTTPSGGTTAPQGQSGQVDPTGAGGTPGGGN
ncbi:MAG: hypothetical protein ACR2KV_15610 [Solirubrobacteraceae bacterium]